MNRRIDEQRLNQSKERTIDFVLHEIKQEPKTSFFTRTRMTLATTLIVIIALVVMFTSPNNTPPGPGPDVVALDQEIAEVTYLTSSFIGASFTLMDQRFYLSRSYLAVDTTEFENNDELINLYFDSLRLFLEEDMFENSIIVVTDEENPNQQTISFLVDEIAYTLQVEFTDDQFTGTLTINDVIYEVTGKLEESEEETKLEFEAVNGDDYVRVTFKTETEEDEQEKKYEVERKINNEITTQQFKISQEEEEQKVVITDGDNEYELKKELEDGVYKYKLKYNIEGIEGSAVITENADGAYHYQVKEGNQDVEITHGRPDHSYDNSNNGNGPDDDEEEEDEDDNPGKSEDNPGKGNKQDFNITKNYDEFTS